MKIFCILLVHPHHSLSSSLPRHHSLTSCSPVNYDTLPAYPLPLYPPILSLPTIFFTSSPTTTITLHLTLSTPTSPSLTILLPYAYLFPLICPHNLHLRLPLPLLYHLTPTFTHPYTPLLSSKSHLTPTSCHPYFLSLFPTPWCGITWSPACQVYPSQSQSQAGIRILVSDSRAFY